MGDGGSLGGGAVSIGPRRPQKPNRREGPEGRRMKSDAPLGSFDGPRVRNAKIRPGQEGTATKEIRLEADQHSDPQG